MTYREEHKKKRVFQLVFNTARITTEDLFAPFIYFLMYYNKFLTFLIFLVRRVNKVLLVECMLIAIIVG